MDEKTSNFDCEVKIVDKETVDEVKSKLIEEDTACNLAEFFKIFGDMTRIKIIHAISLREMCVCDIAALLESSHSAVSHQLKILRQFRLVKPRKDGKMVYYSLCDHHVSDIFNQGLTHLMEKG